MLRRWIDDVSTKIIGLSYTRVSFDTYLQKQVNYVPEVLRSQHFCHGGCTWQERHLAALLAAQDSAPQHHQ